MVQPADVIQALGAITFEAETRPWRVLEVSAAPAIDFVERLHPEDRTNLLAAAAAMRDGDHRLISMRVSMGEERVAFMKVALAATSDTRVVGLVLASDPRETATSQQLDIILRNIPVGITVQDRSGALIFANDAAARISGYASATEMIGMPREKFASRYQIWDEAGARLPFSELPGALALHGKASSRLLRYRFTDDIRDLWSDVEARPVYDSRGAVRLVINIIHDVTERIEREQSVRLLAEAATVLSRSLDLKETVTALARVPVPLLASACQVYICDGQGVPQLGAEHDDGHGIDGLASLQPKKLLEIAGATTVDAPAHHILLVPLVARGKPLGALALARTHDDGFFTPARIALAEEMAARAALFVDNAKLYLEAQRAIAARDDFLAVASHDLKSPLGAVLFSASVLKRIAEPGPVWEHVRHTADSILHAATSMERLVHDLVDLAALDAGLLSTLKQRHVAGEIVADAVQLYDPLAAERSVSLRPEGGDLATEVLADRGRVLQVLGNLIANAVTYAPPDSAVTVAASDGEEGVIFSVRDLGPGIDGDLLPRIFDRYTRGRARGGRSVGLGLSIASKLVEAHGGRIWVESQPGRGTCFHFTVPRAA